MVGEGRAALSRGLAPRYGSPWRHRLGTLRASGPSRKSSSNGPGGSYEKQRPEGLKRGLSVTDTAAGGPRRALFARWYHREILPRRLTTERVFGFFFAPRVLGSAEFSSGKIDSPRRISRRWSTFSSGGRARKTSSSKTPRMRKKERKLSVASLCHTVSPSRCSYFQLRGCVVFALFFFLSAPKPRATGEAKSSQSQRKLIRVVIPLTLNES